MWNHLYSGVDQARLELNGLPEDLRMWLTKLGEEIMALRTNLVAQRDNRLARSVPMLLQDPWIKFSADIAFADEAVTRASAGFDRYVDLRPILTAYELSDVAAKCLEEAGRMFLFSFDNGCIMSCGATLEQILREELENAGKTPSEKPLGPLIQMACKHNLLSEEAKQAACELKTVRNDVVHRPFEIFSNNALKDQALNAMNNLGRVLKSLS